jgi:hypothetical protein
MEAAVQLVATVHNEPDTAELRDHIKRNMKEGIPQEHATASH